jgi:hypothetical protein
MAIFQLQMSVTVVVVQLSRLVKYRSSYKESFKYLLLYAGTETLGEIHQQPLRDPMNSCRVVSCRVVSCRDVLWSLHAASAVLCSVTVKLLASSNTLFALKWVIGIFLVAGSIPDEDIGFLNLPNPEPPKRVNIFTFVFCWLHKSNWRCCWCPETETIPFYWTQLSRFHLKTETESSLRNVVF